MTLIDDFENGLGSYGGNTGDFTTSTTNVKHGSYRLDLISGTDLYTISSTSGLNTYPQPGDIWRFWYCVSNNSWDEHHHYWATQSETSTPDGYLVSLSPYDNTFGIQKRSGGNMSTPSETSHSWSTGWHEVEIDWGTDGSITATLYDNSGTQLASITTTDTEFTSGGIGWEANPASADNNDGWDYARITNDSVTETDTGSVTPTVGSPSESSATTGATSPASPLQTTTTPTQAISDARVTTEATRVAVPVSGVDPRLQTTAFPETTHPHAQAAPTASAPTYVFPEHGSTTETELAPLLAYPDTAFDEGTRLAVTATPTVASVLLRGTGADRLSLSAAPNWGSTSITVPGDRREISLALTDPRPKLVLGDLRLALTAHPTDASPMAWTYETAESVGVSSTSGDAHAYTHLFHLETLAGEWSLTRSFEVVPWPD